MTRQSQTDGLIVFLSTLTPKQGLVICAIAALIWIFAYYTIPKDPPGGRRPGPKGF